MRKSMAAIVVFVLMFLFVAGGFVFADDSTEENTLRGLGPIAIRNQMPLYLFYLQMAPDRASVTPRNKFLINADYMVSNITVSAFTPVSSLYDVQIDMDVSRLTLDFRYGLYDNLEIGLEVPYIGMCSGYTDNFVEGFEDGIGARTPRSREHQGSYEFDYSLKYNGRYLIHEKASKQGLGEVVFNAKYQLVEDSGRCWSWPNISVRSAVKFPTANKSDLTGSGEFDYGFGLLADKGFCDKFFIYLGGNAVMIQKPSVLDILGIKEEIYSYMLALEYFFTGNFSVVTQVTGNTTPYPESNTNPLDNKAHDWALGFNYIWKEKTNVSWNFAVVENISAASSPDVSFHTALNCKF